MRPGFSAVLVHTGQHYSPELSDVFFEQLGFGNRMRISKPGRARTGSRRRRCWRPSRHFCSVGISPHGCRNGGGRREFDHRGGAGGGKLQTPVIHLEAGLRSFDRAMPEEINRLATDAISDLLLVSEPAGETNLRNEGVPAARVRYVGNVMIDTLASSSAAGDKSHGRGAGDYALVTLHRPSNVDSRESLTAIADFLAEIAQRVRVVFPVHPRTKARLEEFGLLS